MGMYTMLLPDSSLCPRMGRCWVSHTGSLSQSVGLTNTQLATEYWMTLDYFPIREAHGSVGGVTCILADQTDQVINARRIRSLHELIVQVNSSQTTTEVCQAAAAAMCTNSRDVSSAYIYMVEMPIPGMETVGSSPGTPSLNLMANQGKSREMLDGSASTPLVEVADGYWQSIVPDQAGQKSVFLNEVDTVLRTMTASLLPNGFKDAPSSSDSPVAIVSGGRMP